jgi:rhodanese-related sulfurtransferase
MKQFGTFVINHWVLFVALLAVVAMFVMNILKGRFLGFKEIKPAEAVQLLNHKDAIVVDVRDDNDFSTGHILNAINLPLGVMEQRMDELEKYRSKPVIISCRTGQQSARAGMIMHRQGFTDVYKLAGGMMAWQSANMPVSKD